MSRHFEWTADDLRAIVVRFGADFYEKLRRHLDMCAEQWSLTSLRLIPSFSANVVFRCASPKYGPAVLKFGRPADIAAEFHTLRQYNGKRFCSVYEADLENGILLEEAVKPGTPLRNEPSLDNRLAVFCSLFEGLHIEADEAERFPTYTGWVDRIAEYMSRRRDCAELARHMQKAKDICLSLSAVYSRRMLLHGDFHHDNMLLAENGTYKIIDPKGVVGDPVFDVPRFVLNEFDEEITEETRRKINKILRVLGQKLRIPETVLKRCLYVETAMGACWSVEDGASPGEYPKLIKTVAFAEAIMNA